MTYYQHSGSSKHHLSPKHEEMLFKESAVHPDVVAERGTFTALTGKDVPQEHGDLPKKPGLVFPVHTLDGGTFCRLRPNNPGRFPKYMQPKGHPNRLDVHPRQHERIKQPGSIRYVTEGERKVDAGVSRKLLMVGVSGVFNGQRDKGAALINDWRYLPIRGEKYSIAFDSDIETNPLVQLAAHRYARLLREAGAEVFITLLPPAPDGTKQGLDDFFANGGTVKELEMLTRPFDMEVVETARLSKDEKLRAALADLERRFWLEEWKGVGGHSARDVFFKLIEAARRHGKVVDDGLRVVKAQGPLAIEAKVSSRTLWKSLNRLEDLGLIYRDNESRKPDKAGAFVLRANVSHKGGKEGAGENATPGLQERAPGDLHLRAPRLRWSRPKFTPKRGMVKGTRMVRQSPKLEAREPINRLGKIRGAVLDAVDAAGGVSTMQEICEVLHRSRPRDLKRRVLPMLEDDGILSVDGDLVTLAPDWLERLHQARLLGKEIQADKLARTRHRLKSRAYHARENAEPTPHWINTTAHGAIEDLEPGEASPRDAGPELESEMSPTAEVVLDYVRRLGRMRLGLLEQIWLEDHGGDLAAMRRAIDEAGVLRERLPEFRDAVFLYPPAERAA